MAKFPPRGDLGGILAKFPPGGGILGGSWQTRGIRLETGGNLDRGNLEMQLFRQPRLAAVSVVATAAE